jgi:error-prone DNA polymerase
MRKHPRYAELQTTTNFSFLQGASHPHEYVWRAAELGYAGIAITDSNSLAGIVRAHTAARDAGVRLIVGCRLEIDFQGYIKHSLDDRSSPYHRTSLLVYPTNRESYGTLCALLSKGRAPVSKNDFFIDLAEFLPVQDRFVTVITPPFFQTRLHATHSSVALNSRSAIFFDLCKILRENATDLSKLSISLTHNYGPSNKHYIQSSIGIARALDIPLVATNDAYYHVPERSPLQDVISCVRAGCSIQQLGFKRFQNTERYLKAPAEIHRLFRETPTALTRVAEIVEMTSGFSLSSLTYTYPDGICPPSTSPAEYLRAEVLRGASERYPQGIPLNIHKGIEDELRLIGELSYEKYFLTCYDIVAFARGRGILCQGRGAAANSIVCFCLGITAVDPQQIDLLFARFISKERQEPPDIDIDFEHERREEVIQYIYKKYGRDKAALTAEVVTYQARSAIRDVCKVFGISLDVIDKLVTSVHRWTGSAITADSLRDLGLNPYDHTIQNALTITNELIGFPRHLSQHVGGFIISQTPLNEIVPIINAGMASRTIIEWDKNDIEELGMLKIDILALGMLTCIRKALELINAKRAESGESALELYSIPRNDPTVYDMLCASDTVGVFQVESRAQMSMLPRLRPRVFYDLVIEVAIVRPGPIQGNMVHPYLRRRNGLEKPFYPDERVKRILGKTLGVPIFQEQAMRLAIVLANFTPGEAEKLRRAMATWKTHKGVIETFKAKITEGMLANGYTREFAETCLNQIKGFSEYGFPESHAASFALLVYASAWIKRHYPAEFACALLNSQPTGFYAPPQIVRDAQKHGVEVLSIDANKSEWNCCVSYSRPGIPTLRLGLRLVRGLRHDHASALRQSVHDNGEFLNVEEIWNRSSGISHASLKTLANADTFQSLHMERRDTVWELQALTSKPAPLDAFFEARSRPSLSHLPQASLQQEMFQDYRTTGLSLKAHPLDFLRPTLSQRGARSAHDLGANFGIRVGTKVSAAGLVITRQRPGTAKGVVFLTLEDETGSLNVVIRPNLFDSNRASIMNSSVLLATGKLERVGEVIYIDAERVSSLDRELMAMVRRRDGAFS